MARIRSVKPEFWADEDLADVSRDARLLYIGLWNLADEHGRLRGDPRYIKGQIFPYDDDLPAAAVDELLKALEGIGKVVRYRAGSGRYQFLPNLGKHQRLEADKVPSKLPPPPDPDESARRAEKSAPVAVDDSQDADQQKQAAQIRADKSAPGADESSLLYVAGSMEHVAGSMVGASAPRAAKPRRSATDDPAFTAFWDAYPLKAAKGAARTAWSKAVKKADADTITAGAERYRDDRHRKPDFTAHPATWLNDERWSDQPAATGSRTSNGHQTYRDPADPSVYLGDL